MFPQRHQDCFHKNWALPCYAVGWEEGCTKLGSQWCGAASALEFADAVEPFMDGDAVDAGTELGEVLQWSLVSVAALALVAACVAVGRCSGLGQVTQVRPFRLEYHNMKAAAHNETYVSREQLA